MFLEYQLHWIIIVAVLLISMFWASLLFYGRTITKGNFLEDAFLILLVKIEEFIEVFVVQF